MAGPELTADPAVLEAVVGAVDAVFGRSLGAMTSPEEAQALVDRLRAGGFEISLPAAREPEPAAADEVVLVHLSDASVRQLADEFVRAQERAAASTSRRLARF